MGSEADARLLPRPRGDGVAHPERLGVRVRHGAAVDGDLTVCACDWNFLCERCRPVAQYDDDSFMSESELERVARAAELSVVDFKTPFRDAA